MAEERGLFLLALLAACTALVAGVEERESLVREVSGEDFQEVMRSVPLAVVQFYAPWCHHCHTYNKLFSRAAELLEAHDILFARVDIEAAKDVKNRFQVGEIPELRLFRRGQMFPYQGPAENGGAEGLAQYMLQEQAKRGLEIDPVLTLTEDNFDQITSSTELMLVVFYTDWCVHCQRLEPHFAAAARRLRQNEPPVPLGKVQVPDQIEVAKRYGVENYPLLLMFRYGKQYNYTGPREEEGIVEYMRRQAGPSSLLLQLAREVREFSSSSRETRAVGFFSSETSAALLEEFRESGNLVRTSVRLGHSTDERVAEKMGFPVESVVVFHPSHLVSRYEPGYSVITELPANASALAELYLENARPLVGEMTRENYDTVYHHRPLLLAYYEVKWDRENIKATQFWHDMLASVAKDFSSSELVFAVANEESYPNDLRALGLAEWGEEVAVGLFAPGPLKYRMTEELTPDSLREFLHAFLGGSLEPHISSEPPPRKTKGVLVKIIVGSTFRDIVLDPDKNVMVKLCIPVLPDCQKASEWYPKVAEKYRGMKDVVFGEMNAALNDPPAGTKFVSLPAFYFSPLGSTEMEEVTPQPTDDADLLFFLKWKQNLKPPKSKGKQKKGKGEKGKGKRGSGNKKRKDEL